MHPHAATSNSGAETVFSGPSRQASRESRILIAEGAPDRAIYDRELGDMLSAAYRQLGARSNVLIVPPDRTRPDAHAQFLTEHAYNYYGSRVGAILPALGTHEAMDEEQLTKFFGPNIPLNLFIPHNWDTDTVQLGAISRERVVELSGGICDKQFPIWMNRRLVDGTHDLILATSHIVPHEVMGFAGYSKQLVIGLGGKQTIDMTHEIAALYDIDRTLGVMNTPSRRIINQINDTYLADKNVVYVMLVRAPAHAGETGDSHGMVTRGVYIGNGEELFHKAVALSRQVNITVVEQPLDRAVVYLPAENYHSFWLAMKGSYRMRLAMAEHGELYIVCPGVTAFGEKPAQSQIIRSYGYCGKTRLLELLKDDEHLQANSGTWAHLTHGSPPESAPGIPKFRQIVCPNAGAGGLARAEVEAVNFSWSHHDAVMENFELTPDLPVGFYGAGEKRVYFGGNPAKGLWLSREAFAVLDAV